MNENIFHYLKQVDSYLRNQQKQIQSLKEQIDQLQEKYDTIQEKAGAHIDKIEYKFDQLKIERLEGTLNIGISPQGINELEPFENVSINEEDNNTELILQKFPHLYSKLKTNIQQFIKSEVPSIINHYANTYQKSLSESHKTFIVQDIERQLEGRIHYFLQQATMNITHEEDAIHRYVLEEMKKDMKKAIETFIKHLPGEENHS